MTLSKQASGTAAAVCPAGLQVIGGGFNTTVPAGSTATPNLMQVFSSAPSGTTAWTVSATNGTNKTADLTITAYAICAVVQ